jgi:hypothetical protein
MAIGYLQVSALKEYGLAILQEKERKRELPEGFRNLAYACFDQQQPLFQDLMRYADQRFSHLPPNAPLEANLIVDVLTKFLQAQFEAWQRSMANMSGAGMGSGYAPSYQMQQPPSSASLYSGAGSQSAPVVVPTHYPTTSIAPPIAITNMPAIRDNTSLSSFSTVNFLPMLDTSIALDNYICAEEGGLRVSRSKFLIHRAFNSIDEIYAHTKKTISSDYKIGLYIHHYFAKLLVHIPIGTDRFTAIVDSMKNMQEDGWTKKFLILDDLKSGEYNIINDILVHFLNLRIKTNLRYKGASSIQGIDRLPDLLDIRRPDKDIKSSLHSNWASRLDTITNSVFKLIFNRKYIVQKDSPSFGDFIISNGINYYEEHTTKYDLCSPLFDLSKRETVISNMLASNTVLRIPIVFLSTNMIPYSAKIDKNKAMYVDRETDKSFIHILNESVSSPEHNLISYLVASDYDTEEETIHNFGIGLNNEVVLFG